jgi:putative membrane protein
MPDQISLASIPLADWHGPGWWIVFVPLGWFAVAFAFFFLFRRAGWGPGCRGVGYGPGRGGGWGPGPGAAEILDHRFAAGEIGAEEYRERRSTLDTAGPDTTTGDEGN